VGVDDVGVDALGVHEVWLASMALVGPSQPGGELVGRPGGADGAVVEHLAAHGVAEGLHGAAAQDAIAVVVQERVHLAEPQPAVAAQQGEAGGAQAAAPQLEGIVERRRERGSFGFGRFSSRSVLDLGPELLSEEGELLEDLDAAGRAGVEGAVDLGELGDRLVSCHLEGEASLRRGALDGAQRTPATEVLHGGLAAGAVVGWGRVDRAAGASVAVVVRGRLGVGVAVAGGIDVHRVASEGGVAVGLREPELRGGSTPWQGGTTTKRWAGARCHYGRAVGPSLGRRERIDVDSLPSTTDLSRSASHRAANRCRFAA